MITGLSTWDLKVHGKAMWFLSFLHTLFLRLILQGFITSYFRIASCCRGSVAVLYSIYISEPSQSCFSSSSFGSGCELSLCSQLKCFCISKSPALCTQNLQKLSASLCNKVLEQKLPGDHQPLVICRVNRSCGGALMSWSNVLQVKILNPALVIKLHLQYSHQFISQNLLPLSCLWDRFKTNWWRNTEDIKHCNTM